MSLWFPTLKSLICVLLCTFSVSHLLALSASVCFPVKIYKIYHYCGCCISSNVSSLWQTNADKASDSYTESSMKQNLGFTDKEDSPKSQCKDSIVPYTHYCTTTVFALFVDLNISHAVENMATEAAKEVYTSGIHTNRITRENLHKTFWDS